MEQKKATEIKALTILHLALLAGQALFLLIASGLTFLSKVSSSSTLKSHPNEIVLLCIGIGIAGYLAGNFLYRKKLGQINSSAKPLSEKFNDYRSACILRWVLLEFAALFSIVLFLVAGIVQLLVVAGALILLFITIRPSLMKTASDLHTSESEIEQMNSSA